MESTQLPAFVFAAGAAIASGVAAVFAILPARATSRELSSIRASLKSMIARIECMATALRAASTRPDEIGQNQAATGK